jgi:LuxR family transcriptional regulator, maltose regulon positive regulatory protein
MTGILLCWAVWPVRASVARSTISEANVPVCGDGPGRASAGCHDQMNLPAVVPRTALYRLLNERTAQPGVVLISAPAGSGKTVLLRSWIGAAGLASRTAWVSVARGESSPQNFWRSVLEAVKAVIDAESLHITPAPDFDGNEAVRRLSSVFSVLDESFVLVIDDLHELKSSEALGQLEVLTDRRPPRLTMVFATRHDPRIGLHRLRLSGDLTEIRASDLCFGLEETRELLKTSGVTLSDECARKLHERTEGWAAGLRLAALSLERHPEPERFVAEFSGTEHTVADYLLAEVLERQPEAVRRLLLRTSMLDRVSGELADVLTGEPGSQAVLQGLEEENAFVASIDASRSWFHYHRLLADLLQLELTKRAPQELRELHRTAARWFSEHGLPLEAIRHAQAAHEWRFASQLLADSWFGLYVDGQSDVAYEYLAAFPSELVTTDPELAALTAARELNRGSLELAGRYLDHALAKVNAAAEERRAPLRVVLAVLRLSLARQRGDVVAAIEEAQRALEPAGVADASRLVLGDDLRALTLLNLGFAEIEAFRIPDAEQHLEEGLIVARRAKRPFLEMTALARLATTASFRSVALSIDHATRAIDIAREHGWTSLPVVGLAYWAQAMCLVWRGRLDEAEPILDLAEQRQQPEVEPGQSVAIIHTRALIDLLRGDYEVAAKKLLDAEQLTARLGPGQVLATMIKRWRLPALAHLGEVDEVEDAFNQLDNAGRDDAQIRIALAWVRVIQKEPAAATAALVPILDGSATVASAGVDRLHAFLLEAIARDMLGERQASKRALESALELAEPDEMRWAFLLHPVPELLENHRRSGTAHQAFVSDLLDMLAGGSPRAHDPDATHGTLTESELRVLRFLPSNLSAPEIATELYLSTSTVKSHLAHIYSKLGVHGRNRAVARARELGLLAPVATLRR